MVRNYKRKTEDPKWTREDLNEAVTALQEKRLQMTDAVAQYKISRATLYRYLKRSVLNAASGNGNGNSSASSKPSLVFDNSRLLNPVEEGALLHTVLKLRSSGTPIGAMEVKQICFEYVVKNNIPNKFCSRQRLASNAWYSGFCKRHPDVLRTDSEPQQELCLETPVADSQILWLPAELEDSKDSNRNSQGSSKDAEYPWKNPQQEKEVTNEESSEQQDHTIYNEEAKPFIVLNSSAEVQGKNYNNKQADAATSLLELNATATFSTVAARAMSDRKRPYLADSLEVTSKPKVRKTAEFFCISSFLYEVIMGFIVSVINLLVFLWKVQID